MNHETKPPVGSKVYGDQRVLNVWDICCGVSIIAAFIALGFTINAFWVFLEGGVL